MGRYLVLLILMFTGCATEPCRGVIGAAFDDKTYVVQYTYPGSPAREIGVQDGDILMYIDEWSGNAGDVVVVQFIRHDGFAKIHFNQPTTLVCIDKLREWK